MGTVAATAASPLEVALTPVIDQIIGHKGVGYHWADADKVARRITGREGTRFYRVTEAARTYGLPREMRPGGDFVCIAVTPTDFKVQDLVDRLIGHAPTRAGMPDTIIVLVKEDGLWRGVRTLRRDGTVPTIDLDQHFPDAGTPIPFVSR